MSAEPRQEWIDLGIHHKTANKMVILKLTPEKVKSLSDEELSKQNFPEDTIRKIRAALGGEVKKVDLPQETRAKVVEDKTEKKSKKKDDEDGDVLPTTLEEKKKIIKKIIKESGHLLKYASDPDIKYGKRSTGLTGLDALLSDGSETGGFPIGKFTLLAGGYQTCKTALAQKHIAKIHADDPEAICIWGDAENSFDAPWAAKQGVDLDRLLIVPAMIADHMIMHIEQVIEEISPACVVIDSIGSLLSWQEVMKDRDDDVYTKDVSQDTMALTARFLSKLYRRWTPLIAKHPMTFVFITHIYSVIGGYAGGEEAKGGNAMKHSSHVTIWTSRRKGDQDKKSKVKMPDGRIVELFTAFEAVFTIHKTRQSPTEGQKIAVPFVYGEGLSERHSVVEIALNRGIIQVSGNWYTHPSFLQSGVKDNGWINGRDNTIEFVKSHDDVFDAVLGSLADSIVSKEVADEVPA